MILWSGILDDVIKERERQDARQWERSLRSWQRSCDKCTQSSLSFDIWMQGCVYIAEIGCGVGCSSSKGLLYRSPSQCDGLRRQQGHRHVHTTLSNTKFEQ